jgi:hypothetical protein
MCATAQRAEFLNFPNFGRFEHRVNRAVVARRAAD